MNICKFSNGRNCTSSQWKKVIFLTKDARKKINIFRFLHHNYSSLPSGLPKNSAEGNSSPLSVGWAGRTGFSSAHFSLPPRPGLACLQRACLWSTLNTQWTCTKHYVPPAGICCLARLSGIRLSDLRQCGKVVWCSVVENPLWSHK